MTILGRTRVVRTGLLAALSAGLTFVGACSDAFDLAAELAAAASGDTVTVPAGMYQGPLTLSPGVHLQGESGAVIETVAGDGPAISVETDSAAQTVVSGLTIRSAGNAAIWAKGPGGLVARELDLDCDRGVGLAAEGLALLQAEEIKITGSVAKADVPQLSFPLSGSDAPIVGLALSKVQQATLTRVVISGFGGFGAALVGSQVTWRGGGVKDSVGVGIMAEGGSLDLGDKVAISGTLAGQRGAAILAYGLVSAAGAKVSTSELSVRDSEGPGVVQDGGSATHQDLTITDNKDVGLWLQNASGTLTQPALQISGASALKGNRGGGVFALASGGIVIDGAAISATTNKTIAAGVKGSIEMADGIQLAELTAAATLKKLTLTDNARVGLLLSGKPPAGGVSISGVTIKGPGMYGLIPENDYPQDPTWQVTRDVKLEQADKAISSTLGAASAKAALPSLAPILKGGLLSGLVQGGKVGPTGLQ